MKLTLFSLLFLFLCFGCKSKLEVVDTFTADINSYHYWGVRYVNTIHNDSVFSITHGFDTSRNCFPGYADLNDTLECYEVRLYNRWGELIFKSVDPRENWICNNNYNITFIEGQYFYIIEYQFVNGQLNDSLGPIEGSFSIYEFRD